MLYLDHMHFLIACKTLIKIKDLINLDFHRYFLKFLFFLLKGLRNEFYYEFYNLYLILLLFILVLIADLY